MHLDGKPVDEFQINAMRDTMFHRGPDDGGTYIDGAIGLGHRRLSIVDLSEAGHQPMTNEDGTVWITFNGEIYNYVELRAELVKRGHRFSSHTDTEVIVHLYEEEGERCVEKMAGMFTFVIWDSRRQQFFVARDRIGIKPLHYYVDRQMFICASEAKAILECPGMKREVDYEGLAGYFLAGFPQSDRTAFVGIKQLPPGFSMIVSRDGVKMRKYWDLEYRHNHARTDAQVVDELEALLDDVVRVHCRSDAALGCHLSGGLDSSTVTGFAARHRDAMKTFSIRFAQGGDWFDETYYARAMSAAAGAEYLEAVPSGDDLGRLLPGLVWHMEMPLPNAGGFAYYTVSRLASEFVKVTLTGHGGDEVFAGYPAQFQLAFNANPFAQDIVEPTLPPDARSTRVADLRRKLGAFGPGGLAKRITRRLRNRPPTAAERWVSLHCSKPPGENPLLSRQFNTTLGGYSPIPDYIASFNDAPTSEMLDRCLYHDLRTYLPGLLYMEDRVSMSVSVESRVPLLDHRLVEFMATVPPMQKVPKLQPKALLRAATRKAIPDEVRDRKDKRGFPAPVNYWLRHVLKDMSKSVLLSPQALDRGVIDADRMRRWDLSDTEIWTALNVELWFRIFIDQDPLWTSQSSSATTALVAGGR
jgi:asparagine synthase (glutamine-hydrolysing)